LRVYELVREAVNAGSYAGPARFAKGLADSGLLLPSRRTIRRWASGATSPFSGKRIFDQRPSEELSFFLGAWIGDGWGDENDGGKRMLLKVRSYDFAKEFADCAAKILHKTDSYWVRRVNDKRGRWYLVKVTSFQLYEFVTQPFEKLRELVEFFPRAFLRGLYTAEGNPSTNVSKKRVHRLDVGLCVSNCDSSLLEFARRLLLGLRFRPGRLKVDRYAGEVTNLSIVKNTAWQFTLSKFVDVVRFADIIGFADSKKQRKLAEAIGLIAKFGSFRAASKWTELYEKRAGEWTRREPFRN
jgi:intein-encoded DNA endonuclease-like protein